MHVRRIIDHQERLARFIVRDDGLRSCHDTTQHRALALVHGNPAPIGDHVPIDIDELAWLLGHQRRQQCLSGINAFELPQQLTQSRAVIAPAKQRRKRMLVRIEPRQFLDPQQGRKKQRLEATTERLLPVMQQGKVGVGMGALMGLDRLRELPHYQAKDLALVQPVGKEMHADI